MKRAIVFIISCLLFGAVASAQSPKVIEKDFEKFSTVKVQDDFVVKLVNGGRYSVQVNVDERIAAHVQSYVKNETLFLILDEKGFTKELKKELNKKGAAKPILEATVYMPELKSLILTDNSKLVNSEALTSENFTLTATDNAKIHQLKVSCATADISVSRSAELSAELNVASKLYFSSLNSAKANLTQNGGNTFIEMDGSSSVNMKATVQSFDIIADSGAEANISGTASLLSVNASGHSKVDVELLEAMEGQFTQTGSSKCYSNVSNKMKVNLTGGATLTYKRTPAIEVDRIIGSTFIKADDPKRK